MPLEAGTQVGRYRILRSLAVGGMGEVYLARSSGPSGFSKVMVLKIIHPALSEQGEFLRMFRNEAMLAALLNHPNVVQVFDFGVEQDLHYMAMEYIDGQSLSRVLRALERDGQRLPLGIALFVIGQVCEALVYAHHLVDTEGKPLNIVHRDISPENILCSYAGQVKLVDFGLVKARTLDGKTAESVVKGKYAFIAPELLQGVSYDHRSDLFSLGVVLYRTVLGRMPFAGEHPAEIFYQILERTPPAPRQLDPGLPIELEVAMLRALAKDPEHRFARARDLQRELESVARGLGAMAGARELAELMIAAFPPGMDDLRQSYQQLAGVTTRTPTRERYVPEASPVTADASLLERPVFTVPTAAAGPHARRRQGTTPAPGSASGTAPARRRSSRFPVRWALLAGAAAAIATALVLLIPVHRREGVAVARHAGVRGADRAARRPVPAAADARIRRPRDAAPLAPPPLLSVVAPGPAELYLDGRHLGPVPLHARVISPGKHQLRLRSPGLNYELTRPLRVAPGEHLRLKLQPGRGSIRVLAHPFAQVNIDGRNIGATPFPPVPVLEGPHLVLLENPVLRARREIRVRVRPGQEVEVKARLDR